VRVPRPAFAFDHGVRAWLSLSREPAPCLWRQELSLGTRRVPPCVGAPLEVRFGDTFRLSPPAIRAP
jgi:hypothetical protein